ncbi:unnamed protein product [Protopolystoma xenopodis]|uniref:Uncharacterized protein n=1 Tax=Protopolystoma xenopodis TaxID=117903 RepID=A0A3S5BV18_9PLAT|nr:unnamed protein product [Protopolystoma xenopodis]
MPVGLFTEFSGFDAVVMKRILRRALQIVSRLAKCTHGTIRLPSRLPTHGWGVECKERLCQAGLRVGHVLESEGQTSETSSFDRYTLAHPAHQTLSHWRMQSCAPPRPLRAPDARSDWSAPTSQGSTPTVTVQCLRPGPVWPEIGISTGRVRLASAKVSTSLCRFGGLFLSGHQRTMAPFSGSHLHPPSRSTPSFVAVVTTSAPRPTCVLPCPPIRPSDGRYQQFQSVSCVCVYVFVCMLAPEHTDSRQKSVLVGNGALANGINSRAERHETPLSPTHPPTNLYASVGRFVPGHECRIARWLVQIRAAAHASPARLRAPDHPTTPTSSGPRYRRAGSRVE